MELFGKPYIADVSDPERKRIQNLFDNFRQLQRQEFSEIFGLSPNTPWEVLRKAVENLMRDFGISRNADWGDVINEQERILASGAFPSDISRK